MQYGFHILILEQQQRAQTKLFFRLPNPRLEEEKRQLGLRPQ
jgi:hypothetical protein